MVLPVKGARVKNTRSPRESLGPTFVLSKCLESVRERRHLDVSAYNERSDIAKRDREN